MIRFNASTPGYTTKHFRQRKFLLIMPLLAVPLLTFLLWSTGLLGSIPSNDNVASKTTGLNTTLPGVGRGKDSSWSKLNFYEAADKEAAKRASLAKSDPYYQLAPLEIMDTADTGLLPVGSKRDVDGDEPNGLQKSSLVGGSTEDPNEVKVYQKLNALNKALEERPTVANKSSVTNLPMRTEVEGSDNDVSRLEAMMQQMNSSSNNSNPEMDQINSMLEKVLDIQHPERVKGRLQEVVANNKELSLPVGTKGDELAVTTLGNLPIDTLPGSTATVSRNQFYSLEEENDDRSNDPHNAISAIIPEEQALVNGATVKLQAAEDVSISGILIPKGQSLFGEATLSNERLKIDIRSIRFGYSILPVKLSVYDLDGVEGIYMPGAIGREVAKQSTDQAIQSMGIASLDPSIGAQAASAGIQATKSLIGKKSKQVRVTVRTGYEVLLYDQNSKH
ncbi:conjugative transposon protein TraM [Chitinophagaceae bacterium 26-R-25]|nr:conjugative transposon protein TraM [Chitinophagaceae bacterium 26-R-25]